VIDREGEFALRAALGASRRLLVRQQLIQALLLAAIGTFAGLLIASRTTSALFALSPEGSDATGSAMREFDYAVRLDWPVFSFAAGVMFFVGLGFGLFPALLASRTNLRGAMSAMARGATLDRSARRWLSSLVIAELAIAARRCLWPASRPRNIFEGWSTSHGASKRTRGFRSAWRCRSNCSKQAIRNRKYSMRSLPNFARYQVSRRRLSPARRR